MIKKGTEAREALLKGINEIADAVKATFGAKGRTALIRDKFNIGFFTTKDGVTVANSIELKDNIEKSGAQFVKDATNKTVEEAGDNTTTCTILFQSLCNAIHKKISLGENPYKIIETLKRELVVLKNYIKDNSKQVQTLEDLFNIAMVSSNHDKEIATIISDIYKDSKDYKGIEIDVVESDNDTTTYKKVRGFTIPETGYCSIAFVNNPNKGRVEYENPLVYLYNGKIKTMTQDLQHILQNNADMNSESFRPLVLVVEDIEEAPLREIILAVQSQYIHKVAVVESKLIYKERKDFFIDASVFLDGKYKDTVLSEPGTCEKVIIDKNSITFINGAGSENVEAHIERLKETEEKNIAFKKRLKYLSNSAAVIYVGGKLPSEISEKKDRIDDAVLSVKSSLEEGYCLGAGKTFLNCYFDLDLSEIFKKATKSCYEQLMVNAGLEPNEYLNEIKSSGSEYGYNLSNDEVENLYDAGIIDSSKALRVALENAVYAAINFAMVDIVVDNDNLIS